MHGFDIAMRVEADGFGGKEFSAEILRLLTHGLTAGLYLARARYRVLILEKDDFGGQITITNEVVRNTDSSAAANPPPTTSTSLPAKNSPSQVAQ